MRGQVLGLDGTTGDGVIAGDDGSRYAFGQQDWSGSREPVIGSKVDFETDRNRALRVFPVPVSVPAWAGAGASAVSATDRNKLIAALLAFFLGTLGVHRFYLGRIGSGIVMLVLSLTFFGLVATVPWAIVDMIRYLVMSDEDFARRYART